MERVHLARGCRAITGRESLLLTTNFAGVPFKSQNCMGSVSPAEIKLLALALKNMQMQKQITEFVGFV